MNRNNKKTLLINCFGTLMTLIGVNCIASERINKIKEIEYRFQSSSVKEAKTYQNYKIPGFTAEIIPTEDKQGFSKRTKDGKFFVIIYDETLNPPISTRLVDCKDYTYRTDLPPRTIDEVVKPSPGTYGGAIVYATCNLGFSD